MQHDCRCAHAGTFGSGKEKYLLARYKITNSISELLEIKLRPILEAGTLAGVKEMIQ